MRLRAACTSAVPLALAALVMLAACSSDGDPPASPTTANPSAASAAVPTPEGAASSSTAATGSEPTATPAPEAADPLDDPEAIAAVVTAAERSIRDPSLGADEVAAWGRSQQRAYQALARHPEWDETIRALLPDDVLLGFDLIVEARRAVADHAARRAAERPADAPPPQPVRTLPVWTIVEPLPADELLALYRQAEAQTGVPWAYLAAINLVETRMGRIAGESSAGAIGPMQFLPSTWAECCVGDPLDPADAILGAATYLVDRGAPDDMLGALYGYNPNDGYVGAVDAYARLMLLDERAYAGFHAWEVYVGSEAGTIRLPVGYRAAAPISATGYALAFPEDVAPLAPERP